MIRAELLQKARERAHHTFRSNVAMGSYGQLERALDVAFEVVANGLAEPERPPSSFVSWQEYAGFLAGRCDMLRLERDEARSERDALTSPQEGEQTAADESPQAHASSPST